MLLPNPRSRARSAYFSSPTNASRQLTKLSLMPLDHAGATRTASRQSSRQSKPTSTHQTSSASTALSHRQKKSFFLFPLFFLPTLFFFCEPSSYVLHAKSLPRQQPCLTGTVFFFQPQCCVCKMWWRLRMLCRTLSLQRRLDA
jgi:hypothetical protein